MAWSMVNTWIDSDMKPSKLQNVYEKNVLKGRKAIVQKYQDILTKKEVQNPILAKWTHDFFVSNADICAKGGCLFVYFSS